MPTTEPAINVAIAESLRVTRRLWQKSGHIKSENTAQLKGSAKRPDILILEPGVSPVVIETEVHPAATVEADAVSRLGKQIKGTGRTILSAIAVRLPVALRDHEGTDLREAIRATSDFEMALYTGSDAGTASRLPRSGWLVGDVSDLSILAQHASVPPDVIDQAATVLEDGICEAAGILGEIAGSHKAVLDGISTELKQQDREQTRRMATAILANAFVFHHGLAHGPGELASVRTIEEMQSSSGSINKGAVLTEWQKILNVNYWPIFDIARRILTMLPTGVAQDVIKVITETAAKLVESNLMRSHDLTGAVFQRLIADRKFLAAYYTTPAASALLAGLVITPAVLTRWCGDDLTKLRMGDFACGTGTLQSIAYQRIGQLHELTGGNAAALHPAMMAEGLVGCDVLPAAAHLTASMLAGAHPTVKYERSSVLTVAYGKREDGHYALGSLDMLTEQEAVEYFRITAAPARTSDPTGETERTLRRLPNESFHLVMMNPPFTRTTGHEGKSIGVPHPMFAAFGFSGQEQARMADTYKRLTRNTSAHGNAGEASAFLLLGSRKVKPGGTLALVLPLTLLAGGSWEASRVLIAKGYAELLVVSIAAAKDSGASFSADTGMGECLLIGRKIDKAWLGQQRPRAVFVVLNERPEYPLVGAQVARQVRRLIDGGKLHRLEDGPVGGTPIKFGDETVGQAVEGPLPQSGPWSLSRIRDMSLAQTAYQIAANSRFWLPGMSQSSAPLVKMGTVKGIGGKVGKHHRDIEAGPQEKVRGPFRIDSAAPGTAPTYPVLWGHHADRERTMKFEPDCAGHPIEGSNAEETSLIAAKVAAVAACASHCHVNRDFRFNSQSTCMQFTARRTIGGRAWPSISLPRRELEKALVAWGNTTFGLLMYWWHSSKQQAGRGLIAIKAAQSLPVIDVTKLPVPAIACAVKIFDQMCDRPLLPMNQIDADPVRAELDEMFARDVLGLDESVLTPGGPLELLRMKLACEPSVHGGKQVRVGAEITDDEDEEDEG